MAVADNGSDLWLATYAGGIYVPGSPIELKDTLGPSTDDDLMDVELGLYLSFGDGVLDTDNVFQLTCQTFQGWAVWRAPGHDRQDMTLLGLYDRVNRKRVSRATAVTRTTSSTPSATAPKRAACFNFDTPDTIRFFDFEIYNGFSYNYAVTTFDYGNTAELSAQGLNKEMLFSPRWTGDPDSPFTGEGNTSFTQINAESTDPYNGQEIYVYPNPLRPGAGIPGAEGQQVVFTNLPPESHVRVFTTAGDDVADLGPDLQIGGNIYWDTVNKANESVAAGVYIYKVEMPARQNHWGRLIIIR